MTKCEADVVRAAAVLGQTSQALSARYVELERAHTEFFEAGRQYDAALKRMLDEKAIGEADLRAAVATIEAARKAEVTHPAPGSNGGAH